MTSSEVAVESPATFPERAASKLVPEEDYEFSVHIVQPLEVSASGDGPILLLRRRCTWVDGQDDWEPVSLDQFAIEPPIGVVLEYDPNRVAKYPISDEEHLKLLRHYRLV